jgi:hypothetical protein
LEPHRSSLQAPLVPSPDLVDPGRPYLRRLPPSTSPFPG